MKKTYEEVTNALKENEKVFVNYYDNVNDLIDDGMDKETLDETYYVFGNPNAVPSELNESFIIVEVEGSTDLPIFTKDRDHKVMNYLKDNHKEHLK